MSDFNHLSLKICALILIFGLSGCTSSGKKQVDQQNQTQNIFDQFGGNVKNAPEAIAQGEEYLASGELDKALFYFLKALNFERNNTKAMTYIAAIHNQRDDTRLAKQIYNEILSIDSNHAEANEQLGLIFLNERMYVPAKDHLNKAITLKPNQWEAHNGLGIIADLEGRYHDAIRHYQDALAILPSSPVLLNNIGYSYHLSGNDREAEKYFERALSYNSKYKRAIYNLALIKTKQGKYTSAISLFNKVMEPYQSYNSVGYLCMLDNQFQQAEMFFHRAINDSPFYYPKAIENLEELNDLRASQPYEKGIDDISEIEAGIYNDYDSEDSDEIYIDEEYDLQGNESIEDYGEFEESDSEKMLVNEEDTPTSEKEDSSTDLTTVKKKLKRQSPPTV